MYHIDEENSDVVFEVNGDKVAFKVISSSTGEGKSDIYLIKVGEKTIPTDKNTFSALRILAEIENAIKNKDKDLDLRFISKICNDETKYFLQLLGGAKIGKSLTFGDFITGMQGGYIGEDARAELEALVLRSSLSVPEIRYNRQTYFEGYNTISPGGGLKIKDYVVNEDGSYTVTPDLEEGVPLGQYLDDILLGYWHNKNVTTGDFIGFQKVQYRITSVDYNEKTFVMIPRPGYEFEPHREMRLGQTGNFTNKERQTYIIIDVRDGNCCITYFDNANTWDPEPAQMKSWFGKKKGMKVAGIDCDNYSAVLQNIIMTGLIFQVDEITGESVRVPIDKGAWVAGKYGYYDRVSHNGALWLCVNDKGTSAEPTESNSDWLKQVSEGATGATGPQGVPGAPGKDGKVTYTWIRYANDVHGNGISNDPTGKTYIGFAYNKATQVESNTPTDYKWSLIKGTDGVPGPAGADGKTTYTWVAYSDYPDGRDMYQLPNGNTKYLGIAVNKETATEGSNPADYTWSLFKGSDGKDGLSVVGGGHWESGKTPYKANTMVSFANCVFLSKVETSNPPIKIARFKNGAFRRKKDGGYILAGKSADWVVHEDWDILLDGRELKGESFNFLGEFASHPANPQNGDTYRNTTDHCTYTYKDGIWKVMLEDGTDGKDGKDYEWIYTRTNIISLTPDKPDSKQQDDYVPEGWTDDFVGADADHQVEWACKRVKRDGMWSEFNTPAIVHRWSKDGENAITADLTDQMENSALTSDGKVVSAQTWNTTVNMWYGTEKLTLDSITCTPDKNLLCATDKSTGVVTVSVSAGAALASTNQVRITVRATKNGQQYSRDLVFTLAGVRGGADAVLYSLVVSASSVSKDKNGNYSVASVSCYRQKSVGGVISTTTDGTLKYSIDGGAETIINNNTDISSGNFTKNLKFVFYVNNQIVDVETVPMLIDGKDGINGKDGLSVIGGGHWESAKIPYKANTIVSFANCVFLSNIETSNPPIAISRFKNGAFRRKKDGGYLLAGKSLDWQVHPDWQMLLDGRELKGRSITFLGSFATAPANPAEGNSYYNTTDKCTYIFQNGVWMVMVSDGKDAKDYEWIYQRGNILGLSPEKPDSKQQDDYVPTGWTDDFLGVDQDHQFEWACKRTKRDGVWSEFNTPAIVHRWSKDGESNILADLDNEMVSAALTNAGLTTVAQSWTTHASMWYGTEKLTLDTLTVNAPAGFTVSTSKSTGAVAISVSAGKSLPEQSVITITLTATKNGQVYSRELTFSVTGVRGGANGADAVIYSLVPSVSSVKKDKNGNYSVGSVSCKRMKTVGSVTSATTDGELKYSRDGAAEVAIGDNIGVASGNFSRSLKFVFYVNGQAVDVETVPMLIDGTDGINGNDGDSIVSDGHWEASKTPYQKNRVVSFAGGSYLSKVATSNPPIAIARFKNGAFRRKRDGGYILAGRSANKTVHPDWQEMVPGVVPVTSYWLDSPVSTINFSSTGRPSPSAFLVTCKQSVNGNVSVCNTLYLAARKYNGSWLAHVGATQTSAISIPAAAGYTQFTVRAYPSASDANGWNDNYLAEIGIGVAKDGTDGQKGDTGATGAFPRDRGVFGTQDGLGAYVWNPSYRDKVIHLFDGVYHNFLVRNYGASVTAAPTSVNGDTNWEAMQKFVNIATNTLFADGANIAGFLFAKRAGQNAGVLKSQQLIDGLPATSIDGETGEIVTQKLHVRGDSSFDGNLKNTGVHAYLSRNTKSITSDHATYTVNRDFKLYSCSMQAYNNAGILSEMFILPSDVALIGSVVTVTNICHPPYVRNAISYRNTVIARPGGSFQVENVIHGYDSKTSDLYAVRDITTIEFASGYIELLGIPEETDNGIVCGWIITNFIAAIHSVVYAN